MIDEILDPVFEDYPLVDDQIKDLISRSFNEVKEFRVRNFRQKPDSKVEDDKNDDEKKLEKAKIRKLYSLFPKSKVSLWMNCFVEYLLIVGGADQNSEKLAKKLRREAN